MLLSPWLLASIWLVFQLQVTPLLISLPANMPGKSAQDGYHLRETSGLDSWLLISTWSIPGYCSHMWNEPIKRGSLSRPCCLQLCFSNQSINLYKICNSDYGSTKPKMFAIWAVKGRFGNKFFGYSLMFHTQGFKHNEHCSCFLNAYWVVWVFLYYSRHFMSLNCWSGYANSTLLTLCGPTYKTTGSWSVSHRQINTSSLSSPVCLMELDYMVLPKKNLTRNSRRVVLAWDNWNDEWTSQKLIICKIGVELWKAFSLLLESKK